MYLELGLTLFKAGPHQLYGLTQTRSASITILCIYVCMYVVDTHQWNCLLFFPTPLSKSFQAFLWRRFNVHCKNGVQSNTYPCIYTYLHSYNDFHVIISSQLNKYSIWKEQMIKKFLETNSHTKQFQVLLITSTFGFCTFISQSNH